MDRRIYWIWLQRCLSLGSLAMNRLFDCFGSLEAIYAAGEKQLQTVQLRPQEYRKLTDKSLEEADRILKDMLHRGGWVLTPEDACFPDLLRQIDGFPAVLYGEGTFPNINRMPAMAVVGTRHPTDAGAQNAYCFAGGLAAAGMVIVSGGALGIDAAAHTGALDVGGNTVLVKAAPPEVEYPQANAALRKRILQNGGAIVTEYPPNTPFYCDYHVRNRLLSGMSVGTCVAEAPARSGALITANLAREQGRDVFAIPGIVADHLNDGAHQQIRKGAMLVTCAADVLEEYTLRFPGILDREASDEVEKRLRRETPQRQAVKPPPTATKREEMQAQVADDTTISTAASATAAAQKLLAVLTAEPCPIDRIAKQAGLGIGETLVLLTELEILGCVKSTAGQQYYKK